MAAAVVFFQQNQVWGVLLLGAHVELTNTVLNFAKQI